MKKNSDNQDRNREFFKLFSDISCFYKNMMMFPLWKKYSHGDDIKSSMMLFLEGYAFERQGRKPDYCHAAVDAVKKVENNISPESVWNNFKESLSDENLNHRNNPLYPSTDPDGMETSNNFKSLVEVLLGPSASRSLIDLISCKIKEENGRIPSVHSFLKRIRGIGDKISSFFLRDYTFFCESLDWGRMEGRYLLQPIDIWIERIVRDLCKDRNNMNRKDIAEYIVKWSQQYQVNPESINMGMWFYGAKVAGSHYRLSQSLKDINVARQLTNQFVATLELSYDKCLVKTRLNFLRGEI